MCRILVWGLVLLVPLPAAWPQEGQKGDDNGMKIEGKLSPDDPKDKVMTKSPHRVHTMKMKGDQTYQIDLVSQAFDAFLRVEDESGKQLAFDDDSGGNLNSRLYFKAPKDGSYRLIATSFDGKGGPYTLTAKVASGASVAANAAFSAIQNDFQKTYGAAMPKLFQDYVKAGTDEAKDKILAGFTKQMEVLADRFAKVAKEYPNEGGGRQAAQMAQQLKLLGPSIKGQIIIAAGNSLREQYEKAAQAKAKDVDELYEKARTYFADGAKKYADNNALATQFKDALYLLEKHSIGKVAPEIEGEDLDGKKFKLSDYRGKVVVLDFWGHW
jgi:hypothetical protein